MKLHLYNNRQGGFSLLELSVVLVIIATLIGGGVSLLTHQVEQQAVDITRHRMETIQDALLKYRRAFHTIPCPSNNSLASSNSLFGRGEVSQDEGDLCDANNYNPGDGVSSLWIGGAPVRTLSLPDEYAYDGWGRRFTYVVDEEYTDIFSFENTGITTDPDVVINDINGAKITNAVYALISHGSNGHGAFSRNGNSRISSASANANEQDNCGCSATAVDTGHDVYFVQGPFNRTNTGLDTTIFDDYVVYGTRAQLRALYE